MKIYRFIFLAFGVLVCVLSQSVSAQSKEDAAEAFNQAARLINDKKWNEALPLLEKAARISDQLGEDAEELLMQSQKYLPLVRTEVGISFARAGKFAAAVPVLELAYEESQSVFDATTERKAKQGLAGVYYNLAEQEQSENQPSKALAHYIKALEYNASIAPIYYNMGQCYQKLDSLDRAVEMYEKALDLAKKTDKKDIQDSSKGALNRMLKLKGAKAKEAQNWKLALELFKKAQRVDDGDWDNYLQQAICANKAQLWDETISAAHKGFKLDKTGTDKARLQFEEAIAWFNKGDIKRSCALLKNITDPAYKAQAAQQIAANRCESAK